MSGGSGALAVLAVVGGSTSGPASPALGVGKLPAGWAQTVVDDLGPSQATTPVSVARAASAANEASERNIVQAIPGASTQAQALQQPVVKPLTTQSTPLTTDAFVARSS